MMTVAHRAGNGVRSLREALDAGVDLVEADVHRYRGRLEIRHRKWLGPLHLWDRGEPVRRRHDVEVPLLADLLAVTGAKDAGRLLLDLKGIHLNLAPTLAAALRAAVPGAPVWICTPHWWMLPRFADDPGVRPVLSAGSRRGLRRLRAALLAGRSAAAVSVRREMLTPAVVAELHSSVPRVLTWPVDTPVELDDARRLGVSGVISKNLPLLRTLVREAADG